jgi:hypothetical protein
MLAVLLTFLGAVISPQIQMIQCHPPTPKIFFTVLCLLKFSIAPTMTRIDLITTICSLSTEQMKFAQKIALIQRIKGVGESAVILSGSGFSQNRNADPDHYFC